MNRSELEFAAQRFAVFAEQVLEPAVYPVTAPLEVGALQCSEPLSYAEAIGRTYEPVEPGWRWGPAWATAWFRLTGRIPPEMAGQALALRFSSGTEALLWLEGVPHQGLDVNHQAAALFDSAPGGKPLELYVEAACNRRLGVTTFWWDEHEVRTRWQEPKPGRLGRCELAVYDHAAWRLLRTYGFTRELMLLFPDDAERGRRLCDTLQRATALINDADVPGSASAAQDLLERAIRENPTSSRTRCFAVGHAHIDTAWLWTVRETVRKCQRSFSTVLRLMERYPDFRFVCTQAQQYAWLEEESPELFNQIAARVTDGRWEPGGAMWIEPDCNIPSGESLMRQILHGTRWWRDKFGDDGAQRYLYLPDSFGFPASLPQIMKLAGLHTFITTKLSWNETNEFPEVNFCWRGIDGSEVLAHCAPGQDYNATTSPPELLRGEKNASRMDSSRAGVWLQPFGHGDGGGGPTDWAIEYARLAARCEGLPEVTLSRVDAFCDELQRRHRAQQAGGRNWPVWDGELYLELHRGTFTTCAWLKKANRRTEQRLRLAEWLTFAGPTRPSHDEAAPARAGLDEAWKLLLLNQFHDTLPGTSIAEVYDDARRQLQHANSTCDSLVQEGLKRWAERADTGGMAEPIAVFNPSAFNRSGLVECAEKLYYIENAPALGMAVIDAAREPAVEPVVVSDRTLSNGILEATIDEAGRIGSLRPAGSERLAGARQLDGSRQPLNQLVLYDDRPRAWEAWDVDPEYTQRAYPVDEPVEEWKVVASGPRRAAVEVSRPLGCRSRITQRYILEAGSPRLDIRTRVEWHEERRLLRAVFPVDVRARRATYEIQLGHIERPTHRNTSWDRAMFEVCAHRWMDLSEPGFGVSLLNDCKYGHSCDGGVLGLSLLRSPKFPDPQMDMGEHEFTYSLMLHEGDWRAAGVDRQAEMLNEPLMALSLPADRAGSVVVQWAPLTLQVGGCANVSVVALKPAEDDDRLIVRLVETHGGSGEVTLDWHLPVSAVEPVNLLEQSSDAAHINHDSSSGRTVLRMRPFQIVTLAALPA